MITEFVIGGKEVQKALEMLPVELEKRILIRAMKKVMDPVKSQARNIAPQGKRTGIRRFPSGYVRTFMPGNLKRAIRLGRSKFTRSKSEIIVGVFVDAGVRARFDAFYGRFIEQGTRYIGKREFLKTALNASFAGVGQRLADEIRIDLEKTEGRLSRRLAKIRSK